MLITDTPPIGRDVIEEFLLSAEVEPFLTGQSENGEASDTASHLALPPYTTSSRLLLSLEPPFLFPNIYNDLLQSWNYRSKEYGVFAKPSHLTIYI